MNSRVGSTDRPHRRTVDRAGQIPCRPPVDGKPIRIPKLAVRNRIPRSELREADTATLRNGTEGGCEPSSSQKSASGKSLIPEERDLGHSGSRSHVSRRSNYHSTIAPSTSRLAEQQPGKKKRSSVLGFLALKEPSTSAWEEFAETHKRAAAAKKREGGGRVTTVGLPSVSSQKLPDHVPKVNSKWDGLPETGRRKLDMQKQSDRIVPGSVFSIASTRHSMGSGASFFADGSQSPCDTYGSISSRPQSLSTVASSDQRTSVQSRFPSQLRRNSDLPQLSPTTRPTLPDERPNEPSVRRSHTFLHSPSPSHVLPDPTTLVDLPKLEVPEMPSLNDYELSSYGLESTSSERSPTTPPMDDAIVRYTLRNWNDHHPTSADDKATFWNSDTAAEDVVLNKAAASGFGPAVVLSWPRREGRLQEGAIPRQSIDSQRSDWSLRTRRPASLPPPLDPATPRCSRSSTTNTVLSPTLSVNTSFPDDAIPPSTDASTVTAHRTHKLSPIRSHSEASTCGPSEYACRAYTPSMASSQLSEKWTMSPKERLGLGGKVSRRSEVLPWEVGTPPDAWQRSGVPSPELKGGHKKILNAMFRRR